MDKNYIINVLKGSKL